MSKKQKITKKSPVPVVPHVKETPAEKPGIPSLIAFDRKTIWFLSILMLLFIGMSSLKLHTSSIGNWHTSFGMPKSKDVLAGKPKWIRMDEWGTTTPILMGQVKAGMPVHNESFGSGNVPVIMGFPVKDISTLLRPANWSYFIFDLETAFAFSWNFNIFFFLASMFLVLMLLTQNNFWLSIFGTFFIFYSSGIQWWSYYISTYMMYLNGMLLSFVYLLYAKKTIPLLLAGVFFLFSTYGYLFNLYPPFQVPLVYLYLALFAGFLYQHRDFKSIKDNLPMRSGVLAGVLLLLGFFAFHYYELTKDTYSIMMNTVYPGKRVVSGGDLVSGKLFSEFFGMFMTETHVPSQWMNISEVSGFLLFLPILLYTIGYNFIKFKTFNRLQVVLSVFLILSMIFILAGIPVFLSNLSLLSMVEARRYLPVAEAGNCILLVCFLADKKTGKASRFSWVEFACLAAALVLFFTLVGNHINDSTKNFFTKGQLTTVTVLFTGIYLLIRYSYLKYCIPLTCILLLGITLTNALVNPLTAGLAPILENPLVKTSKAIHEKDPDALWAVFGSDSWAELLKSNGIRVLNGIKITPLLKEMAVIDSAGKNNFKYNRFAHIKMKAVKEPTDSVIFEQPSPDGFTMYLDPCSPRLEKLGIKYFLFTDTPDPANVRCMTAVDSLNFYLFKRKE